MKWSDLRDFINAQVHDNAKVDFIVISPKTAQVKVIVRNYGESFSVSEVATKTKEK